LGALLIQRKFISQTCIEQEVTFSSVGGKTNYEFLRQSVKITSLRGFENSAIAQVSWERDWRRAKKRTTNLLAFNLLPGAYKSV
jgi:hypothetical protein